MTDQEAILTNSSRVRLVHAVPGSGKTWLIAEAIKRDLSSDRLGAGGIAALSFTRIGGEEIRRAVGYDLHHPHYVGTIDAFIYRYIVRPFLKPAFSVSKPPKLIPAEWNPRHWKAPEENLFTVIIGTGKAKRVYNLFDVVYLREAEHKPVVASKTNAWSQLEVLDAQAAELVRGKKKQIWKKLGLVTHSDSAFLASRILQHPTFGPIVRATLVQRFPMIIVDELQDTGWYLAQSIIELLKEPGVRGLLAGDPDQAIYEFNGASPDVFNRFADLEGIEELRLEVTRRCSQKVCTVAQEFAQSGRTMTPSSVEARRVILLHASDPETAIESMTDWLVSRSRNGTVKIITRKTVTIERMVGTSQVEQPKLGSAVLNHLHRAVCMFRQGKQKNALASSRMALNLAFFKSEDVDREVITDRGMDLTHWKSVCVQTLVEANRAIVGEDFQAWGRRVTDYINGRVSTLAVNATEGFTSEITTIRGAIKNEQRDGYLNLTGAVSDLGRLINIQTVHGVKGETHDLTVLVCPKPRRERDCITNTWWPQEGTDLEDRRIAYVAVTRTQGDLVVLVSTETLSRLRRLRSSFVEVFECMAMTEFLMTVSSSPPR